MKIAIVTTDGQSVDAHFGRATHYMVVTLEEGRETGRELRDKLGHRDFVHLEGEEGHTRGHHPAGEQRHAQMITNIRDCQILVARGMGMGAYENLKGAGITPILTDVGGIDEVVAAYLAGNLADHPERLH